MDDAVHVQIQVVELDAALDVHNKPAKYRYFVRVELKSFGGMVW